MNTNSIRNLGSDAAIAIGRFNPNGVTGYKSKSDEAAPIRATRQEAVADERAYWLAIDRRSA